MYRDIESLSLALASALKAYPGEQSTILRGYAIALNDGVHLDPLGVHIVMSDSHPGEFYQCNGGCTCRAHATATDGRCEHRYAVALAKKAAAIELAAAWESGRHSQATRDQKAFEGDQVAQVCSPVRRELAGFSGPTARHH